ncbi:kinase-like domain-containing protein [Biscogniauxia mediterranea]|nr:kinase-like domain-containing protein [Biscogniauxia mediterranea]
MEDPKIIASIYITTEPSQKTDLEATETNLPQHLSSHSHHSTPKLPQPNSATPEATLHQITFETIPRTDIGIIFGCSDNCDVVLPRKKGVAYHHGVLTFNANRQLIYRDLGSEWGSRVRYLKATKYWYSRKEWRSGFHWIIGGHKALEDSQAVIIEVGPSLEIQIIVHHKDFSDSAFTETMQRFRKDIADNRAQHLVLNLQSPVTEPIPSTHIIGTGPVTMNRLLGSGTYGNVSYSWNVSTGDEYAIKRPSLEAKGRRDRSYIEDWKSEAGILRKLSHPHIIKLLRAEFEPEIRLYLEYIPSMTLLQYEDITHMEALEILQQCLSALDYLHGFEPPIVHRDISPGNILVQSRDHGHIQVKLADFGLARQSRDMKAVVGTPIFTAPELQFGVVMEEKDRKTYTSKIDIWSLGAMVYDIIYGIWFETDSQTHCQLMAEDMRYQYKKEPCGLNRLLCLMLVKDPTRRIATRQCYSLALGLRLENDLRCYSLKKGKHQGRAQNNRSFGLNIEEGINHPKIRAGDPETTVSKVSLSASTITKRLGVKRRIDYTKSRDHKRRDMKLSAHSFPGRLYESKTKIPQTENPLSGVYHPDNAFGDGSRVTYQLEEYHYEVAKTPRLSMSSQYYTPEPEEIPPVDVQASAVEVREHRQTDQYQPLSSLELREGLALIEEFLR